MLHTLHRSPWLTDFAALLRLLSEGDELLLLQDGVTAAVDGNRYLESLRNAPIKVYALNEENMIEDCDAMGSDTAPYVVQYADIYGIAQYESVPSEKEAENACTKAFAELNLGLTIEQARKEAARCFHCGHCKACGTCVEDCPGYVLEMRPYQEAERPEMVHGEECWHCANCRTSCPCSAIGFTFPLFMQV